MDLLDRYLAAVAALLPKEQREDIVAELRDTLLSRMEDEEARLGRPLTRAETEAVLRDFGHPIAVAGRYGPSRGLVGPELYPFYMFAVKGLLVLAAVVSALPQVVSVIIGGQDAGDAFGHFTSGFFTTGLTLIGAATLVAAGIERGWIPVGGFLDWKVADLPRLDDKKHNRFKSRFEASFEVSALALFILWWTGAVEAPWSTAIGKQGLFLAPAEIWTNLHLPVLLLAVWQLAASLMTLIRPDWVRARAALYIVADLGGLALAVFLWRAGRLVEVLSQGSGPSADEVAGLQTSLDLSFHITAGIMIVVLACKTLGSVWQLVKGAPAGRGALA